MQKERHIIKECQKHKKTIFILEKSGYYRCTKCRSSHVTKRRRKVKALLVEHFGNKCSVCGYNKCIDSLTFHHKNPAQKEFGLSHRGLTRSLEKALEEANKCILLCLNCHAEVHAGLHPGLINVEG